MKRAALYIRVSALEQAQEGCSIGTQEDKNTRLLASLENRTTDSPGGVRLSAAPKNGLTDLPGHLSITIREMLLNVKDNAEASYLQPSRGSATFPRYAFFPHKRE